MSLIAQWKVLYSMQMLCTSQTNQTLTSFRSGCAPKTSLVLYFKRVCHWRSMQWQSSDLCVVIIKWLCRRIIPSHAVVGDKVGFPPAGVFVFIAQPLWSAPVSEDSSTSSSSWVLSGHLFWQLPVSSFARSGFTAFQGHPVTPLTKYLPHAG